MVAIVAGNGLGLFNTSGNILGGGGLGLGMLGQSGGRAIVNATNGNLVLQFQDEQLSGRGRDLFHLRTYNSQGEWNDGDADGWRWEAERKLTLNGVLNSAGSSVTRTGGDGHQSVYTWDAASGRYVSTEGSGAHDTIRYQPSESDATPARFIWTDGSSRQQESYAADTLLLQSQTDTSGSRISYTYDGSNRLRTITDEASRQYLELVYATVPGTSHVRLQRVNTYALTVDANGRATDALQITPTKQVEYGYDTRGRLTSVTTDLTPTDGADSAVYVTSYTYVDVSERIASITQSDGSRVDFTYDDTGRIRTVTDASGTQTFTYFAGERRTDVQDGGGRTWSYYYDAYDRLIEVRSPAPQTDAPRLSTRYEYDTAGNVSKIIDARGNAVEYAYDSEGNRVLERDALGNTITRTFNELNQLVTETRYKIPDPDGAAGQLPSEPLTTRYVYDQQSRLRFVISAEGRVTEQRYGTNGLLARTIQYAANGYDVGGLTPTTTLSEAQLTTWVSTQDKRKVQQSQFVYDYRGNLATRTDFAVVTVAGEGVLDAAATRTEYIYSAHGELLQTLALRGNDRKLLTSYGHDGMGRETIRVDRNGTRTTAYDGSARTIQVTNSAGLIETRSFDDRGRLVGITQSASATPGGRVTQYLYDAAGRLRMIEDPQGNRRFSFYDDTGRLVQQVDSNGAVVGFEYNANGQLSKQTRYLTAATGMQGWVSGNPPQVTQTSLVVPPSANDRVVTFDYDAAGRLTSQTDAANVATEMTFDGASRLTSQSVGERITRYFYDGDGNQVGVVDALGYLTEYKFDAAGRRTETLRYDTRSPPHVGTAPIWTGVTNRSAVGRRAFEYRVPAAYDRDGGVLNYSVVGTLPAWLTFDASSLTLRGTPPAGLVNYDVTLRVSDGTHNTDVTLRISVGNSAPSWEVPAEASAPADAAYRLVLPQASDLESSQLTYSMLTPALLPPGLQFDASSRTLSGTPTVPGIYTFVVRVSDGSAFTDRTVTLRVTNNVPQWSGFTPPRARVNTTFDFTVPAALDSGTVTYQALMKPSWLEFDPVTRRLFGTPPNTQPFDIVIEARDAIGETTRLAFAVPVDNSAPTWGPLPAPPTFTAGYPVNYLPPPAVDPENQALTYSVAGALPSGLSIDPATGRITGTTNAVGQFAVLLRVTDPHGYVTERSLQLVLQNAAPVYQRGLGNQTYMSVRSIGVDRYLTIPADAFVDPNGDILGAPNVTSGLPSWITYDVASRTFHVQSVDLDRTASITVAISDSRGGHTSHTFSITIIKSPPPPPPPGTDPQFVPDASSSGSVASTPTIRALRPVVDVLAPWRPSSGGQLRSYQYHDAQGRLTGAVDEQGFLSEYVYDEATNKQRSVRYMNRVTVGADDTLDTLKGRAGTDTRTTTTEYDDLGRVSRSIGLDGSITSYEYDSAGRMVRKVSADGTIEQRGSRIRYNAFGEVTGMVGGVGDASGLNTDDAIAQHGMRFEYDSLGRQIRSTDANGNRTLYYYDSEGRLTHTVKVLDRTQPQLAGEVSETVYTEFGEVKSVRRYDARLTAENMNALLANGGGGGSAAELLSRVTLHKSDALDHFSSYEYDQRGLLKTSTNGERFATAYEYNLYGQLATQVRTILKAAAGVEARTTTTRFEYDLRGQQVSQTADFGGLNYNSRLVYDAYGRVVQQLDGAGKITRTHYHDGGRRIEVVNPLDASLSSEYDALGRVLHVKRRIGGASGYDQVTTYAYNDTDRTLSVTTPEGVTVKTTRNRHGEVKIVEDGRHQITRYKYDADGQLTTVIDALDRTVLENFYQRGRLTHVTDARGVITQLSYDEYDRVLERIVDPDGLNLKTVYKFDALGQQVEVREGVGSASERVTSYKYDRNGQLLRVMTDPNGLKLTTHYHYDGVGNTFRVERGTLENPSQRVTVYEFDNLGRRTKEIAAPSSVFGAGSPRERNLTTEYRYDAAGRVSRTIDANGKSTWFVYDDAGQLTYTINALGEVSRNWYDENGRVMQTRSYFTRLTDATLASLGDVVQNVEVTVDNQRDARSYFAYDADGRQRFALQVSSGGNWIVSENRYDASGNVVEARRYDLTIDGTLAAFNLLTLSHVTVDQVSAQLAARNYSATRFAYDANNRLRFTVDALGSVAENVYDNAGNVVTTTRYAVRPTLTGTSESAIDSAVNRSNSANQVSHLAYDKAGRLAYSVRVLASNAEGTATAHLVSRNQYNALGQLVLTTSYAQPVDQLANYDVATLDDALASEVGAAADNRKAAFAYDAAGRQVYSILVLASDRHVVTRRVYDALGQVVQSTAYATTVGALADYAEATLDAATSTSPHDRTTSFVYDAVGRGRFVVAADGSLSETLYDAMGRVIERRQFDMRVQGTNHTEASLSERRAARNVGDGVTRGQKFTYDAAGRLKLTTDALGKTEAYLYDGLGNRTHYTNKMGDTWSYGYDRLGRLTWERSPRVAYQLSSETSAGAKREIETRFEYDTFGHVTKRYEAYGTVDVRLTSYSYDRLGRQEFVTLPGYYDPASGKVEKGAAAGRFQRTIETTFDALGNLVRTQVRTAVNGYNKQYKTYDKLGRVLHDVDALNQVTAFTYNAFGEHETVTRHSTSISGTPANASYWTAAEVAGKVGNDTAARTIKTSYDNLGRKTKVTQPASDRYYDSGNTARKNASSVTPVTSAAVTRYEYTVFGEVRRQSVKLDDAGENGRWRDTWSYHDVMGREDRTIDAQGYQTARRFDAFGNLVETIEYATPGTAGSSLIAPATPVQHQNDRITTFVYDARNQQTEIHRKGLRYAVRAGSGYADRVDTPNQATRVALIEYDAEGRVKSRKDAMNNVTTTEYNELGQITKVIEPLRAVAANAVDPFSGTVWVAPVTQFTLNAFGQTVQLQRDAGPAGLQTTGTVYDHDGNVIARRDARQNEEQFFKKFKVDALGRVTHETQTVTTTLGNWRTVNHTIERRFAYDATGRQTDVSDVYLDGTVSKQSGTRSKYNAFGEVVEEYRTFGTASVALGALQSVVLATYEYDSAGQIKTKTAGDGKTYYYYNLAGQVTRQEQVAGTAIRVTEIGYDTLGRATIQRLPSYNAIRSGTTSPSPITPVVEQMYDRWGNVLTRSRGGFDESSGDVRERRTVSYEYNHDNQVTVERLPQVTAWRSNGTSYLANVSHELRYDVLGRAVDERERVNDSAYALRTRTKQYDAAGQLTAQTDATGIITRYAYDGFGNRVGTLNGLGTVYVDKFDANGNVLSRGVLRQADGAAYVHGSAQTPVYRAINAYVYDQANRRVRSGDVMDAGGNYIQWTETAYDERNFVRAQRDASGKVTWCDYDALGLKVAEGLRDVAGAPEQRITLQTWDYSFGEQYGAADNYTIGQLRSARAGDRVTGYEYDGFGQLSKEIYSGAGVGANSDRTYTYHENGLLKDITDRLSFGTAGLEGGLDYWTSTDIMHYEYTVHGERASENYQRVGTQEVGIYDEEGRLTHAYTPGGPNVTIERSMQMAYDAMGRLSNVTGPTSAAAGRNQLHSLTYGYDELGNRRNIQSTYKRYGDIVRTSNKWYDYDAEGRMTLVEGTVEGGQIVAGHNGTRITYDALGRRLTAEKWLKQSVHSDMPDRPGVVLTWQEYREERYQYNDLNFLIQVEQRLNRRDGLQQQGSTRTHPEDSLGGYVLSATREYDIRGAVTSSSQYSDVWSVGPDQVSTPQLLTTVSSVYRADGQLSFQHTLDASDSKRNSTVTYDYDDEGGTGRLEQYQYRQGAGTDEEFTNTYTYEYTDDFGGFKEERITVTSSRPQLSGGVTENHYDSRGNLLSQTIANAGQTRMRSFSYDVEGHITSKSEWQVTHPTGATTSLGTQDFFYAGGREVGSIGSGNFAGAQFSNGYTPISAAYPATTPGNYVVSAGDTLASIARAVYGDASLWYLIADANSIGGSPDDVLSGTELGRTYRIPNVVSNRNNADTFKPYNPASIIGNSAPMPGVPAPPALQCGDQVARVVSVAVVVAIAVAVSAYTGGALSSALGPILANAVGAAAGSVVSQTAGIALGVQDDFSGRQVISASVTAAASGFAQAAQAQAGFSNSGVLGSILDAPGKYVLGQVGDGLAGVRDQGSNSALALASQVAMAGMLDGRDTGHFAWRSALAQVGMNAVNPETGWLFNDRSRDWATIAQQAVSAFTSVAVAGAIRRSRAPQAEEGMQLSGYRDGLGAAYAKARRGYGGIAESNTQMHGWGDNIAADIATEELLTLADRVADTAAEDPEDAEYAAGEVIRVYGKAPKVDSVPSVVSDVPTLFSARSLADLVDWTARQQQMEEQAHTGGNSGFSFWLPSMLRGMARGAAAAPGPIVDLDKIVAGARRVVADGIPDTVQVITNERKAAYYLVNRGNEHLYAHCMQGMCGTGRGAVSAGLVTAGVDPSRIFLNQIGDITGGGQHGMTVYLAPDGKAYLIDTTYAQFTGDKSPAAEHAEKTLRDAGRRGARMRQQLLQKGYFQLDDDSARLYAKALTYGPDEAGTDEALKAKADATRAQDFMHDRARLDLNPQITLQHNQGTIQELAERWGQHFDDGAGAHPTVDMPSGPVPLRGGLTKMVFKGFGGASYLGDIGGVIDIGKQVADGDYRGAAINGGIAGGAAALSHYVPAARIPMLAVGAALEYHGNREAINGRAAYVGELLDPFGWVMDRRTPMGGAYAALYAAGESTARAVAVPVYNGAKTIGAAAVDTATDAGRGVSAVSFMIRNPYRR